MVGRTAGRLFVDWLKKGRRGRRAQRAPRTRRSAPRGLRRATLCYIYKVLLSLHHDRPESESCSSRFKNSSVLGGLKALDSRARRKGLAALDPARGALIPLGMEIENGRVTKN